MSQATHELTRDEAGQILRWWIEAGVDVAVAEQTRQWLKPANAAKAARVDKLPADIAPPPASALPAVFNAFRAFLETATGLPLDRAGARRILPHGLAGARIMLLSEMPAREDAGEGRPIGGEAWALAERMLAAIGVAPDEAYSASLACFHVPGGRVGSADLERCAAIARHHIALVRPNWLLLLGEAPARALLGEKLAEARGRVHKIEGVRAVATYHPRWLLQRPADKALAWRDLLLLTEDE